MSCISFIVPVYNEVKSIKEAVSTADDALRGVNCKYEIIFVEDGSTDGTREYLQKTKLPQNVKVLYHPRNKGYGAAIKTGVKNSVYDFIFIADCDGTYPLEKTKELAKPLLSGDCDMVVGARIGKGAEIPLVRRPAKFILQALANYLTGEKIQDLNSGFRGMKKDIIMKFMRLLPDGFSFTTTITLAMLTNGYNVRYIPIPYNKRQGRSKIHPIADTVTFIKLIIRTVLYFNPLKIFLPLSGSIFVSGVIVYFYTRYFTPRVHDDTVVVIILASFQIFAIGLIADLIDKRIKD